MRAVRAGVVDPAAKSEAIARRMLAMPAEPGCWFVYVSFGDEVETHGLIRALLERGESVAVPRIIDRGEMVAQRIDGIEELMPARYGIPAPVREGSIVEPARCVLPCVAVTTTEARLGMGGGYYDRYLATRPVLPTVVLAFDEQVIDHVPTEPHDRPVDRVVTPTRTMSTRRSS